MQTKQKVKLIAICGKSASGKDTLLKELLNLDNSLHEIISCTTRPRRENEINGKNYYFITKEEFFHKCQQGEMLETTTFRDWYYGTAKSSLDPEAINVGVFNVEGIDELYNNSDLDIYVVEVVAPAKMRLIRSLNREAEPDVDEIIRRYLADEEDFEHFYGAHSVLHNNINSKLDLHLGAKTILTAIEHYWAKETN